MKHEVELVGTDHEGCKWPDCCFCRILGRRKLWSDWYGGKMSSSEWGMVGRGQAGGGANSRWITSWVPSRARAGRVERRGHSSLWAFPKASIIAQLPYGSAWLDGVVSPALCLGQPNSLISTRHIPTFIPFSVATYIENTCKVRMTRKWLKLTLSSFPCNWNLRQF